MQRAIQIEKLQTDSFDVLIIGGGASGLGLALDATTRGYKTLLVEARDFTQGTSSRSTKLLHGGVRYLAQGNFALVYEALHERGALIQNAPHLCAPQGFVIPCAHLGSALFYGLGLKFYAFMAGKLQLHSTNIFFRAQGVLPGVQAEKCQHAVCYYDGQFDDARLGITLCASAHEHGALLLNYMEVIQLLHENDRVCGVVLQDQLTQQQFKLKAKCIINATGVFTNTINKLDPSTTENNITPSQGIHLVLDPKFLPSKHALMVPKTSDGRVLFAIPWHEKLLVGTTDTPVQTIAYNPKPLQEEINFLLSTLQEYLILKPTRKDILSVFAGLRPLITSKQTATKNLSRSHKITIAPSGLVHLNGGKWTTYRAMAEETLDMCIQKGFLEPTTCQTRTLKLHGYTQESLEARLKVYGTDAHLIQELEAKDAKLASKLHPNYPYTYAQVLWALDQEMAYSLEDVLSRRIRLLFLDARASLECARDVGDFIGAYWGWDTDKKEAEIATFEALAQQHILE
ncbi:glycerol-3-phosphate dehydrogenase/oxidase [Helicobacter baculiformis]|uniref:Glycerol-3-phosphate dehydrogenase/oxidase n=1 Tax=Helicobacter baculiformis TaxID=427351 RepID=A0ABV7ZIC7_9HELI|nr:glycerol-3-phosphate dehydrogenase/oxidase [Helicobacter baculiformis]